MIDEHLDYFEDFEIEHDFRTYYANGYIEYNITRGIGGSYEGYAFEIIYQKEICDITFSHLWYFDEETDEVVDILNNKKYEEIEEIAKDEIRYRYE